tara:strand:+ start:336 stop:1577 length:1242 start_codon:yes stop_codon:yes gene_type:complete
VEQLSKKYDFLILGGGMVGLSIAYQLVKRKISNKIIVLDKEEKLGLHTSGRNSGVLHAGLYYKPNSLKAKICVSGAKRLKEWVKKRKIPLNECGKIIIPTREDLDNQLDILLERGKTNGANVKLLDRKQILELIPEANTPTERGLWSPNTAVVKPIEVIRRMQNELINFGVEFVNSSKEWNLSKDKHKILFSNNSSIYFDRFINCTGLQADKIAHKFGVGKKYTLMPFKGVYYQIKKTSEIKIRTNLYPVPDLNLPFLGVHFTPGSDKLAPVSIGPTASLAFGRENYRGLKALEPFMTLNNINKLAGQYFKNKGGFRKYVHEQAFLSMPIPFLNAAKSLIPKLQSKDIELSQKVGIRSQLFNNQENKLEDDFLCLMGENSIHILNAISPAFTASFSLADHIIDQYIIKNLLKN